MIARILIKDFKLSFKSLILSKVTKKRVHNFAEYISALYFDYFKKSRTYKSKYFFLIIIWEMKKKQGVNIW